MRFPQSNEANFRISPVITTEYLHHNNGWYHCCSFRDTRSWSFHHVLKTILSEILAKQNAWDVASPFSFALSFQCCTFLLALTPAKHLMSSSWQRFTCGVQFEKTFTSCILKPVHTRVHCFLQWAVDTAGPVPTVMLSEMDSQKDTACEAVLLAFTFLPVSRNFTTLRRSCACVAKSLILTGTFL